MKLSVVLNAVSPINMCEYEDWFNDEPYTPDEDHEIDVPSEEVGELDIHPVKLKPNRQC